MRSVSGSLGVDSFDSSDLTRLFAGRRRLDSSGSIRGSSPDSSSSCGTCVPHALLRLYRQSLIAWIYGFDPLLIFITGTS